MDKFVWNELSVYKYFFGDENNDYDEYDGNDVSNQNRISNRLQKNKVFNEVFIYFTLIFGLVVFFFINKIDQSLPAPLKLSHLDKYPENFNAERAQIFLKKLTDIGPRVVGSKENENTTVALISNELNVIKNDANSSQKIEIDYQTVSGSYYLVDSLNVYSNVQNIIVRLKSSFNSSHAILVNCHFDSVPTSPGGSDNGINCAAMLEVLRVLSYRSINLNHDVIFLFNGAEETRLQASHGFIKYHEWAKNVKLFINLDSAGAGGKEILFQAGPNTPWLLRQYSKAIVHPSAQSIGEEIFQSGMIPSDTDFRIFRDFGHIPGIDLAFYKNGYVYHTKYDGFKNIPLGSYQHIGDNLLSLVETIANSDLDAQNLNISAMSTKMIYFDFLGQFLIVYSSSFGIVINSFTIFLSLFIAYKQNVQRMKKKLLRLFLEIGLHIFFAIISWTFACVVVLMFSFTLQYFDRNMSWFNHTWNLIGVYYLPTITAFIFCYNFLFEYFKIGERKYSLDKHIQIAIHANRLIFTFLLFLTTLFAIRSSYVFMVPVLLNTILCHFVFNEKRIFLKQFWSIVYFFTQLLISTFSMYHTIMFNHLIIPITGRMGSSINSELIMAFISFLMCILISGLIIPVLLKIKNSKKSCVILITISILNIILIILTPIGFPYRVDTKEPVPQRYYIEHTERIFYDWNSSVIKKDSGYFFLNMDMNSPSILQHLVSELNIDYDNTYDCEHFILCGLPVNNKKSISAKTTWIPSMSVNLPKKSFLKLSRRDQISEDVERLTFMIIGSSNMHIIISPLGNAEIYNWSFTDNVTGTEVIHNRKFYFILYNSGKPSIGSEFQLDIKSNLTSSDPILDVVFFARFKYHNEFFTKNFQAFLNSFPDWAQISPSILSYQFYTF